MANENADSMLAASDTAGSVMVVNATGAVANTEYSASSGGYSAGYSAGAQFPAVPDDGDAVCVPGACNPHHTWTVRSRRRPSRPPTRRSAR